MRQKNMFPRHKFQGSSSACSSWGYLPMSEKFRSQDTSTQMRTDLTRSTSAPTLGDEITRTTNLGLLDAGKPVAKMDGTLFSSLFSPKNVMEICEVHEETKTGVGIFTSPKTPSTICTFETGMSEERLLITPNNQLHFRRATFTTYSGQVCGKLYLWIEM